jgi:general secretion pathway protein G
MTGKYRQLESVNQRGMRMKSSRRSRTGFTLIELLVVIMIITLLGVFVAPPILKRVGKAKRDLAKPRMTIIESALQRYQLDCGRLPDDSEGLDALLVAPADLEGKWDGPYLKASQLLDPWGNRYVYMSQGQYNPGSFDLISYGADGQEGGEGDNADIVND